MKRFFIFAILLLAFTCKKEVPPIPDNKTYIYRNSYLTFDYKDWMIYSLCDTLKYLIYTSDTLRFMASDSTTVFGDTSLPAMTIIDGDTTLTYDVKDHSTIRFKSGDDFIITFGLYSEVYNQSIMHNVLFYELICYLYPAMICGVIEVPISSSSVPEYFTGCGNSIDYYESMEINGHEYNDVCHLISDTYTNTSAYFCPVEGFIQFTFLDKTYNKIE